MSSIDDIEISDDKPPAPPDTVDVPKEAQTTMGEFQALSQKESDTAPTKEVRKGKKVKRKMIRRKEKE